MNFHQTNKNAGDVNNIDSRGIGNIAIDNSKNKPKEGLWAKIFRWILPIFKCK